MRCEVEYTDEFEIWWNGLLESEQRSVNKAVTKLALKGVALRRPDTSGVKTSRHGHMRELRVRTHPPIRIFYTFDPRRTATLLIGGHKPHPQRFYEEHVKRAGRIYDQYLCGIEGERQQGRDRPGGGRSR